MQVGIRVQTARRKVNIQMISRLLNGIRRRLNPDTNPRIILINGKKFTFQSGSVRSTPDYDDAWFVSCACHSRVLLDVGSNDARKSLMALMLGTVEKVVLVEANPEALMLAAKNLIRNKQINQANLVLAFAAETVNEELTFWTTGTGAAGSMYFGHAKTAAKRGDQMRVSTLTVDSIVDSLEISPDLIKIDVEGAEWKVLRGAIEVAQKKDARFLVEMHSNPELSMEENANRILQWCSENEYSAWYLKEHIPLDDSAQIAHRGRCHLLLQPQNWPYPEWLRPIPQSASIEMAFAEQ